MAAEMGSPAVIDTQPGPAVAPGSASSQAGPPAGPAHRPLMTLAEAAARTGRPQAAVRAALRRDLARPPDEQRLGARKNNAGEWLIAVPAEWLAEAKAAAEAGLEAMADEDRGRTPTPAGLADTAATALVETLAERLAGLEQAVAGRVAELEHQLGDARVALAVAQAERDAARTEVNLRAEGARAEAAARAEASERLIAELRAQVDRLDRPFWRRWLG
jgi:hypothetical protein